MFIELAFVIVKTGKQPKYPTVGTHLNELWHVQTLSIDQIHVFAFNDRTMFVLWVMWRKRGYSTVTLILLLECVCIFLYIIKKKKKQKKTFGWWDCEYLASPSSPLETLVFSKFCTTAQLLL